MSRERAASGNMIAIAGSSTCGVAGDPSNPFTIIFWFKGPDNAAGSNFAEFFGERSTGEAYLNVQMKTTGAVSFFYRPGGFTNPSWSIQSGAGFDDDAWHWLCIVGRGASDAEVFINGSSVGTSTTTLSATETPDTVRVFTDGGNSILNGFKIARLGTFTVDLSIEEAKAWAYGLPIGQQPHLYWELEGAASPEPDWSGNGFNGTLTGSPTVAPHPPIAPPFQTANAYRGNVEAITPPANTTNFFQFF